MPKYTYKDIIIDPNDERLEGAIGKDVYYEDNPVALVRNANQDEKPIGTLIAIDSDKEFPFVAEIKSFNDIFRFAYTCIIIKQDQPVGKKVEE